jgi:hypothetical protein
MVTRDIWKVNRSKAFHNSHLSTSQPCIVRIKVIVSMGSQEAVLVIIFWIDILTQQEEFSLTKGNSMNSKNTAKNSMTKLKELSFICQGFHRNISAVM